jgi:signal peptidase II
MQKNEGFAMGKMSDKPQLVLLLNAAMVVLTFITWIIAIHKKEKAIVKFGLALMLGGGLSNLYDRLTKGHVIDFFSIKSKNEKLERIVFNLADVFVLFGGLLVMLFSGKKGKKKAKAFNGIDGIEEIEEDEDE